MTYPADRLWRFRPDDHMQDRVYGSRGRHRPLLDCPVFERAAGEEFHRNDWRSINLFRAIDVDAVRVIDGCGKLSFAQKTRAVGSVYQPPAQRLQRDAAAMPSRSIKVAESALRFSPLLLKEIASSGKSWLQTRHKCDAEFEHPGKQPCS